MNPKAIALLFRSNSELREVFAEAMGDLDLEKIDELSHRLKEILTRKLTGNVALEFTEHEVRASHTLGPHS